MNITELVIQARNGSGKAFENLYSLVYKDMYYYALSKLRSENDACDAVSDAVLDAYCAIKKLKKPENFKSWIFTILSRKICKKYLEYKVSANAVAVETENVTDENFTERSKISPDLSQIEVDEILDTLSDTEREIFSLCYVCGFTSDEIGGILQMNSSTVRSHLLRARNKLKTLYSQ